ncbi:MAG: phosphatidate cytidylyltransferase [Candidatus Velamenicoccus archaeovorus]
MPEGDKKDDLFEDLDKFFAPIQDVDWPETEMSTRREPRDEPSGSTGPEDEEPHAPAPGPGQEGLFEPSAPTGAGTWEAEHAPPAEPADVGGTGEPSTLDRDDEEDAEPAISVESFMRPPDAYVDLPGAEPDEGTEAELDEGVRGEEAPSPEAVEAAAEHFAESVRDEGGAEPRVPAGEGPATTLPDLFGEEEAEEIEEEPAPTRTVRVGPEGLGGPSWQEPTAVEVGAELETGRGGRDVPAAFLTGLVLAGLAVGSIAIAAGAFAVVAGIIVLWAQGEFYRALQKQHHQPATALGLVSGALVLAAGYFRGEAAMLAMLVLSVFATFLWYMAVPAQHRKGVAANVGLTALGVAYVPLLAGYALALLDGPDARAVTVSVIGLTFAYDTAAFIVGSWWGSRPLAPTISPKKSVEGALGATLVVIAVSAGLVTSIDVLNTLPRAVGLAVVVAVFAPLGDLAESLLKRDLGLKDMGSILPGHGGVLDRIDSVLFVAPAAYFFLRLILL